MTKSPLIAENFERFFREFYPRVKRFIAWHGFSAEDAEDLAQDVMLRAYRSMDTFRGEAREDAWTLQIAHNVLSNYWRNRRSKGRSGVKDESLDSLLERGHAVSAFVSSEDDPGQTALSSEQLSLLRTAIDELPPQQRRCIMLSVYHNRTIEEIAILMKISESSVKSHLALAKTRLRARLNWYSQPRSDQR